MPGIAKSSSPPKMLVEGEKVDAGHLLSKSRSFIQLLDLGIIRREDAAYYLSFVGWLAIEGQIFISLPKIAEKDSFENCVPILVKVLSRYSKGLIASGKSTHDYFISNGQLLDLFLHLSEFTDHFGWCPEEYSVSSNELNDVDWEETFQESIGVRQGKDFLFANLIGNKLAQRPAGSAVLQAEALLDLRIRLGILSDRCAAEYTRILEEAPSILELGEKAEEDDAIIERLRCSNRDHERRLSDMLLAWKKFFGTMDSRPMYHGVRGFAGVWEEMLRDSFVGLGTPLFHPDISSTPSIVSSASGLWVEPSNPRPDILIKYNGQVLIFDAKWYAYGKLPGADDIVKQLFYQMASHENIRCNAFLVPKLGQNVEVLGNLGMRYSGNIDGRFPSVLVIGIPWMVLFKQYSIGEELEIGREILEAAL